MTYEEIHAFVYHNLGLGIDAVKRLQVNHALNCAQVKCSELRIAQETVMQHNGKHEVEMNKHKYKVKLCMDDGGVEVKIHDLSKNVTNEQICDHLKQYGEVLAVKELIWGEKFIYKNAPTGTRVVKMMLRKHIKSYVTILGEKTYVSYFGQPSTCKHCANVLHAGMTCAENKKLVTQKSDLNNRLKLAQSYAGVAGGSSSTPQGQNLGEDAAAALMPQRRQHLLWLLISLLPLQLLNKYLPLQPALQLPQQLMTSSLFLWKPPLQKDHTRTTKNHQLLWKTRCQQSLYSAGDVADPDGATTNRAIPSDSVPNAQVMEEITTEQLYNIIKTSASRKAPGNDGIPKEFYVRTFHVIHRQLNLVINEALNGNIPQKLVEGVIVLCHKKGGNNTIKSYRPLTMLNFDYKILSRILKTRIEEIMVRHDILTPSQKCSNGKRNIFEALLAVKDRIAQIKHTHIQGTLVSFDLDHAFDRVEHSYLFRVMDDMGFNRALIQLLRTIMDHSRSRVLVNGHLSPEFEIRRSVRQGDPMSMHLFVLHLNPLLEKIRTLCNDQLDLSTAYADDISVIVVDNTKLPTLKQLFFDFGRYSGAVLNLEKTVAMNIGRSSENLPWPSMETRVKILGINFFNDHKQMIQFNWDEVIRKTTQLMWMYKARNLTLIQKVTVLNMFVTSKLWFVASVLSIRNQDIARITRQLGFFLWGRQLRVPMEQICQPIAKGGLNLHLPMHKCRALLVNRFLCTIAETPFAEHLYGQVNNGGSLPATYPCLRPTWTTIREFPQQLRDNPCSSSIESHLLQALPTPKISAHTLVRVAPLDDPTTRGQHRYCAKHREGNPYLDGAFAKDITIVDG
ncbi:hypothetical protein quinque_004277 [Culex quinquefasciatus]